MRKAAKPGERDPVGGSTSGGVEGLDDGKDEHPVFDRGDQDLVLGDEDPDWPYAGPGERPLRGGTGGGPLRGGQDGDVSELPGAGDDDVFLGYGDGEDFP